MPHFSSDICDRDQRNGRYGLVYIPFRFERGTRDRPKPSPYNPSGKRRNRRTLPKVPKPQRLSRFIVTRGDTTDEVRELALISARATFKAQQRMRQLEQLDPKARRRAWNRGPERKWLGLYGVSRKAHFGKVKRRIDLMAQVFRGRRSRTQGEGRPDRVDLLTIESFNCNSPGSHVCNRVDRKSIHPVERWENGGTPTQRLAIEKQFRLKDRAYICCRELETLGIAFRAETPVRHVRDLEIRELINLGIGSKPHKIALCPRWFNQPQGRRARAQWSQMRRVTIAHEVAHLAGAMKLKIGLDEHTGKPKIVNAEVRDRIGVRRLALLSPYLARINAENYARYVMEFATP